MICFCHARVFDSLHQKLIPNITDNI